MLGYDLSISNHASPVYLGLSVQKEYTATYSTMGQAMVSSQSDLFQMQDIRLGFGATGIQIDRSFRHNSVYGDRLLGNLDRTIGTKIAFAVLLDSRRTLGPPD